MHLKWSRGVVILTKVMEGKVAIVTGAGSGIGKASAIAFAREGAKVVIADVATKGGQETVRTIREAGGEAVFAKADVSKATDVQALVDMAIETYDRLDFAHNNAGVAGTIAATADCTEQNWDQIISINLKGVWLCMKHEIQQMLRQGSGAIVNTSSTAGLVGSRGAPAYAAASHGIVGLTKSAALEYAEAGIRVNAVCPGVTHTPMIDEFIRSNPAIEAQLIKRVPLGRMATPEEIAQTVLWLCSDAASFVTGHTLVADGGLVAS